MIDSIGIGTSKSATTTISMLLSEHPQICFSIPKELRYYNKYKPYRQNYVENHRNQKSVQWLLNHFVHWKPGQVKCEFSPSYLIDQEAPANIFKQCPDVKLMLSLRNPIERAYSAYQQAINFIGEQDRGFRYMLDNYPEYIEKGKYYKYLMRWLEYFSIDQIHILFFEDFVKNPGLEIKKLFTYLEVDNSFTPPSIHKKFNASRTERYRWIRSLEQFLIYKSAGLGLGTLVQQLRNSWIIKLKRKIQHQEKSYIPIQEEDKQYLIEVFRADVEKLSEFLNRDLSHWLR